MKETENRTQQEKLEKIGAHLLRAQSYLLNLREAVSQVGHRLEENLSLSLGGAFIVGAALLVTGSLVHNRELVKYGTGFCAAAFVSWIAYQLSN